jgi:hypothetical protein
MLALNDDLPQTMQGATLAGTVRIGAPQDFAALLPDALRQFAKRMAPQVGFEPTTLRLAAELCATQ